MTTVATLAIAAAIGVRGDTVRLTPFDFATPEYAQKYSQNVFGVSSNLRFNLGGVVVLQNGDVIVTECAVNNARVHRFSAATTVTVEGTPVHPDQILSGTGGGCGIALHPDGYIYSNVRDLTGSVGVVKLQISGSSVAVVQRFPLTKGAGNAIGVAVDPRTGNLVYSDAGCSAVVSGYKGCNLIEITTSGQEVARIALPMVTFAGGIAFDPTGAFLFATDRPTGYYETQKELVVINRATNTIAQTIPLPIEPVGLGFSATSPKFIITNNQDDNNPLTRLDFPGDDYRSPPSITAFAYNGFRGDLIQAGPDRCLYVTQHGVKYNDGELDDEADSIVQICDGFAPPPGVTPNPTPPPSSLCGVVYNDVNNDGSRGSSEPGIGGVAISLSGTDTLGRNVSRSTSAASDGGYCFNDLKAGTYSLSEAQPSAYLDGKDTIGSAGGGVGSDAFTNIPLAAGVDGRNYNFGELAESSLSGSVYVDANDDGIRDAAEAPIAGVKVTLSGPDDRGIVVNMIGTTGTDGGYRFSALRPGSYTISESQPPGYRDGKDTQGTPGTGVTANDTFAGIVLLPGTNGTNNNFGELPPAAQLCGFVYDDVNNNGVRQSGEAGIAGVTISLAGTDSGGRPVARTATTANDGRYCFDDLNAGTYTVAELPGVALTPFLDGTDRQGTPGNGTPGDDRFVGIVLRAGDRGDDNNFGEIRPSSLAGFVYVDANDNGSFDPGELPIAGVPLRLTYTDDRESNTKTTATDSGGRYRFTNLRPGSYAIAETQPGGYRDGKDTQGTPGGAVVSNDLFSNIVLATNVNGDNNNFGELPLAASFGGFVYDDANNDGIRGAGEAGIAGVKIALAGKDDVGRTVAGFVTTGDDGSYRFNDLEPGVYTITESSSPALAQFLDGKDTAGTPATGTVGNDAFTNVDLRPGVAGANNNFGEIRPSSLAGFVYLDANDNGLRDTAESAIAGVSVQLTYTDDRESKTVTALTDAGGRYAFTSLRPGTYAIAETQPAAYRDGKDSVGTAGAGSVGNDTFSNIVLTTNVAGDGYNFGERLLQDDLRITVSVPGTVTSGTPLTYSFTATNGGPSSADGVVMTTDIPATMTFTSMTPPAGWTCTSPARGATGTIRCEKTSMAVAETATLTITAFVACTYPSPGAVPVVGQIAATTPELNPANNVARGTTTPVYPVVTLKNLSVTRPTSWPPNHKMVDIGVNYTIGGGCGGPPTSTLTMTSDDGADSDDFEVINDHLVQVRSERTGPGNGRTYTITITARDAHGNSAQGNVEIFVPHDQGKGKGKK